MKPVWQVTDLTGFVALVRLWWGKWGLRSAIPVVVYTGHWETSGDNICFEISVLLQLSIYDTECFLCLSVCPSVTKI